MSGLRCGIEIAIYYEEIRIERGIWQFAGCPTFCGVTRNGDLSS